MTQAGWQFWIDRGGTFTDLVACTPTGSLLARKLLSDAPDQYQDAAAQGVYRILSQYGSLNDPVDEIRMGTTVATNALLERSGPPTAFVTNRGFADVLEIGNQQRPDIFALEIVKPKQLYDRVIEVGGRLDADGTEIEPVDKPSAASLFSELKQSGLQSIAICLLHAWRNPAHEILLNNLAKQFGFDHISLSHEVSPLIKVVDRGVVTVADAYLTPVLLRYTQKLQATLEDYGIRPTRLLFMQSNGGLVDATQFRGKDAVLSGPAGGVMGIGVAAKKAATDQLIGFDMGGTSTDVSLFAGEPEMADSCAVAGFELRKPTLRVHTIAAGGGSLLKFESGRFKVGPESAGANPGPKSYGRNGPLTVTDANLLLGRIQAKFFPRVFGEENRQPLNEESVAHAFQALATKISNHSGNELSAEETAAGFLTIAIDNMANAIKQISIQRGENPADFALCCFGGAAGQHACQLADRLGMDHILIDPMAGVLSARGIGAAPLLSYRLAGINKTLNSENLFSLEKTRNALENQCRDELQQQGIKVKHIKCFAWLDLRQAGSDTKLRVPWLEHTNLREEFRQQHQRRFGFTPTTKEINSDIDIATLRVEAVGNFENLIDADSDTGSIPQHPVQDLAVAQTPTDAAEFFSEGQWITAPVFQRDALISGVVIDGPALVVEANSTTVLEANWQLEVNSSRQLVLTRLQPSNHPTILSVAAGPDPILLEIFNNRFMHIAAQMGAVLEQTAHSVNIKERLDFSCALFDATGNLLANAPHIPVHLGSMDSCIKNLIAEHAAELRDGVSFAANAPYKGGTHLPDITVITPLLDEDGELLFVTAARAHHADIGGISPGSMPPESQHINEEGIVLDNLPIVIANKFREANIRSVLGAGRWPARNIDQNIADLKAQLAANQRGRSLLIDFIAEQGVAKISQYCEYLLDNAERSVRDVIDQLGSGSFRYPMDSGQEIVVNVVVDHATRSATLDFTGTSPAQNNNLNAPIAVCHAAIMYVFRTLIDVDIPLNSGCRRPLKLIVPKDSMLNPQFPAAVVGGNVETSQAIVNALYGALGVLAASQGTMNNLSFGTDSLQYYETICGGAGAGSKFRGAAAVQTHMTNSRITDPEILESRFPVLLREFSIRKNTGGAGRYPGGNGVIRKLEFRERLHAAILSNHRVIAPFGLNGGEPGMPGYNAIIRSDGTTETCGSTVASQMLPGDTLVIATPGGGGYGTPDAL